MNRYGIQKYVLQWMLSEPSEKVMTTIEKDDRLELFQRTWTQYFSKRLKSKEEAKKKLRNMFVNLVISSRSYDDVIKQTESALKYFWVPQTPIPKPQLFKKYRFLQSSKEPVDSHIKLFDDLLKETGQRGTRGRKAREKLINLCYCFFYLVACRKDTYTWLKNLLNSM